VQNFSNFRWTSFAAKLKQKPNTQESHQPVEILKSKKVGAISAPQFDSSFKCANTKLPNST